MAQNDDAPPPDLTAIPHEDIAAVGRGVVFVLEDRVCLEVPELGRLEFPPDVAEKVASALLTGAKMLRVQGTQQKLVTLLT